jgi:hypothetical protein
MTTRMIHPQHGATHVYGQSEIERHEKLGWAVEIDSPAVVAKPSVTAEVVTAVTQSPEKRKPGRPARVK